MPEDILWVTDEEAALKEASQSARPLLIDFFKKR
jgi:hypothetical protein